MQVLVVEDDESVAAGVCDGLIRTGFDAHHVATGAEAIDAVAGTAPDFVLLDLGLPDMDGTDVCRAIRAGSQVPIIVVSARGEEIDRVLALEMGADDYVVKPFGMHELVARIRAVGRRVIARDGGDVDRTSATRSLGALNIDRRAQRVHLGEREVHLTPKEFDLLWYLTEDPGAVYRRSDILHQVWGANWYGTTKTLDAHVAAIRKKLGDPRWIEAVRGVGFRIGVLA
ncbi:response regulator transcription factor [Mycobacterium sp. CVI_P3]|uniref:Sensory transduction protein RegX3 n=1 Tax=Mycobacterium pinniadriaticum TaxID=2994102 RepID=A0ABT3SL56_9MYCO|nr:response regulator transcription factor [Mycobacterium pinniadriaticum]MCX2933882.1 response regulator transcription factor [Mycobacterium pinniadriaticum]MCX2940265.1 response regulator transcription factor [Mycobacterium pinniadriaticum]